MAHIPSLKTPRFRTGQRLIPERPGTGDPRTGGESVEQTVGPHFPARTRQLTWSAREEEEAAFVATRSFFSYSALRAVVGMSAATLVFTLVPAGSSTAEPSLSLAEVTRQVAALNEEASNANEDFLEAQINVDNASRRLSSVQSRISREQRNLNRVQNDISSLASIAYRSGGLDSSLELICITGSIIPWPRCRASSRTSVKPTVGPRSVGAGARTRQFELGQGQCGLGC